MNRGLPLALILVALLATVAGPSAHAQGEADGAPDWAPKNVTAEDKPNDAGGTIVVRWEFSTGDAGVRGPISGYRIERATSPDGPFRKVEETGPQAREKLDKDRGLSAEGLYLDEEVYYRVVAVAKDGTEYPSEVTPPVVASAQMYASGKTSFLFITLFICGSVVWFIQAARRGKPMFIRKIAGLEAVDEAIGRATEMGRPILFVPGIQDMNDIQTVAGITILGRVAKGVAEYGAGLNVPTSRSLVMTAARETVKSSYLAAGRPDAYNDDMVYYLTDEQFGYVAAVTGIMVREKPAACFYQGAFFAESLILAETGNTFGAIQIAGTAMPAQLPFFVAACDYTLIGEEFFAASAYLSGEPQQLGSLKGQDLGKALTLALSVIGTVLLTLAFFTGHGVNELEPMVKMVGEETVQVEATGRPRIAEQGTGGELVRAWELEGVEIGKNAGSEGELWVEIAPDAVADGAHRITLFSDSGRTRRVAEGKGFVGTKVPIGPVGGSGLSGAVWLVAEGETSGLEVHTSPTANGLHGWAETVRGFAQIEK